MSEVRYERLHPVELRERVASAPLAFVPIGTIEFHGEHLPFGVDGFEAHGICVRAAELAGGVVLPPLYLASGCLDLPFTLSFELTLVEQWVRATLRQLAHRGFRAVVVLTGHGPLDLNHLLKRVAAEIEQEHSEVSTYALCWLELNAARLSAPETGEPTCVDHAARVETSLMLALEPELVHLDRLSEDPTAAHEGIYGPNPRFTASREFGETQIRSGAELLAQRARDLLGGAASTRSQTCAPSSGSPGPSARPCEVSPGRIRGSSSRTAVSRRAICRHSESPSMENRCSRRRSRWSTMRPVSPVCLLRRRRSGQRTASTSGGARRPWRHSASRPFCPAPIVSS